jgi:arsenate reductase
MIANRSPISRVLFLCTGNACRSQMAEGLCRALCGGRLDCRSAGVERHGLDPRAVAVMAEIGIDISAQYSKIVDDLVDEAFDCVVTVCDRAREICPVFPGAVRTMHRGFDDPPRLARDAVDNDEALRHYRRVRDQIKAFVLGLPTLLDAEDGIGTPDPAQPS